MSKFMTLVNQSEEEVLQAQAAQAARRLSRKLAERYDQLIDSVMNCEAELLQFEASIGKGATDAVRGFSTTWYVNLRATIDRAQEEMGYLSQMHEEYFGTPLSDEAPAA